MPRVQIVAASEPDLAERSLLRSLKAAHPDALLVLPDTAIARHDGAAISSLLDRKADVTIVLSGIRWSHLEKLASPALLPNPVVVTSNVMLQHIWSLKPAVIVQWSEDPYPAIREALLLLRAGPVQFAEPGRTFSLQGRLWIRRDAVMDANANRIWDSLRKRVWPGFKIRAWSFDHGDLGWEFSVVRLDDSYVTIRSPKAQHLQEVPKEDFLYVASLWPQYTTGGIPRNEIRDRTRYSTYILGLLHWLELERAL